MRTEETDLPGKLTVASALDGLALAEGFMNPAAEQSRSWYFEVFGFKIYCYNFNWRKKALAFHDLHHVVTGYPCTMLGEMQIAAWEFAAGPCPSFASKLFCLPLIAMGDVLIPRQMLRAFRNGSRCRSLYGRELDAGVRNWPVAKLRALTEENRTQRTAASDYLRFAGLSAASFTLLAAPLVLGYWLLG